MTLIIKGVRRKSSGRHAARTPRFQESIYPQMPIHLRQSSALDRITTVRNINKGRFLFISTPCFYRNLPVLSNGAWRPFRYSHISLALFQVYRFLSLLPETVVIRGTGVITFATLILISEYLTTYLFLTL